MYNRAQKTASLSHPVGQLPPLYSGATYARLTLFSPSMSGTSLLRPCQLRTVRLAQYCLLCLVTPSLGIRDNIRAIHTSIELVPSFCEILSFVIKLPAIFTVLARTKILAIS